MSALPEFPSSEILIEVFLICTLIAEKKGRNYSLFCIFVLTSTFLLLWD